MTATLDVNAIRTLRHLQDGARRTTAGAFVGFVRIHWRWVLATVAFVTYVAIGVYLVYDVGYVIQDSTTRTGVARAILFGRDPHLAALGSAWMPLPTLAELPLMAVFDPLGWPELTGPVMNALFGAGSVVALAAIGARLGLRPLYVVVLTVVYTFNPVVALWSSVGMSEVPSIFFLLVAVNCFLAWVDHRGVAQLGALGLALGIGTLTRYENLPIVVLFAAAIALVAPRGRRMSTALIAATPSLFAFAVWLISLHVLRGDAFIFYKELQAVGTPPPDAVWLPADRNLWTALDYTIERLVFIAPIVLLVVPLTLASEVRAWVSARRPAVVGLTLLACGAVFPVSNVVLLARNSTFGNLRYFISVVPVFLVLAMWLTRRGSPFGTWPWRATVVVLLAVGVVSATAMSLDPTASRVEAEYVALRAMLLGRSPSPLDRGHAGGPYRDEYVKVTDYLDSHTSADDLIGMDTLNTDMFTILSHTKYPDRFAIAEDRDFDQLLQLTRPPFTWMALVPSKSPRTYALLSSPPDGREWKKMATVSNIEIYRLGVAP